MAGGIDPDAPLDYAEFELFPGLNRYEVCACSGNKVETIESGLLEHLLLHSPEVKNINSKKLNATFKIQVTDSPCGAEWFTKSILRRFLHVVGSPNILHITKNFETEISQLEETRRFQLSIDVKGHQNLLRGGKTDGGKLNGMAQTSKVEVETVSLDASKNELLRAMDLRIAALKEELADAFNQATGTSCSLEELMALEIFSHHFGAMNIRNSLRKFLELNQKGLGYDLPSGGTFLFSDNSRNGRASKAEDGTQVSKSSPSNTPVKYGVSPAKVAQLERQSSTESEESSFSSEEEQPAVERSRTLIRSASPRRSASPMRRVQIGRSGSRRASALTIKSLSYYPGRERVVTHMDAANSEEEGSEQPPKKSENNAERISVQAAISLFESKQKDQIGDIQKAKSFNTSTGAKKSVLRRWSSGMGERSPQSAANDVFESRMQGTPDTSAAQEISQYSQDLKQKTDSISGCQSNVETLEIDFRPKSPEERSSGPIDGRTDAISTKHEEKNGKSTASAECGRQKEAELNQLLMKMIESKPVNYQKKVPDNSQRKNVLGEQKGGLYDDYKQKRDAKLRAEVSGKQAEKEAQLKAMQKFFDERKAEMGPTNASGSGRHVMNRAKKPLINSSSSASTKKEISKPAVVKRTSAKASPLPATRKSWPSTPLPRDTGISPAKTPVGTHSTGSTDTCRKSQPASALPRSSPKVERVQPRPKTVKTTQVDSNKGFKVMNEKKQQTGAAKTGKKTITKTQTASGDHSSTAKPSLYNKMTKKSSVVPLESKPFLRKGSGTNVSPVIKTKVPSLPEESVRNSRDVSEAKENELVTDTFDVISQQKERDSDRLQINANLESESQVITFEKYGDTERPNLITTSVEENVEIEESVERFDESTTKTGSEEESSISPAAWVEIEEEYRDEPIQYSERSCQIATATNVAAVGLISPRVRHSLSQMLLEESSEPDSTEWGNAEVPPAMVYQKDAPKGLKRLLKFARKSKMDTHLSGWSSPSAFSEGEDEAEEYKGSRKNADNLLRKSALNVKNYGPQKTTYESYEKNSAQSGVNKFAAQSAHKMQEAHISASVTTSKVSTATTTRSFFSLSAFKGSKPNETKLR